MNKTIHISISEKLLTDIEKHIDGHDRSQKLLKCIALGYRKLILEK